MGSILPKDVMKLIFKYVFTYPDDYHLLICRAVCKTWYSIIGKVDDKNEIRYGVYTSLTEDRDPSWKHSELIMNDDVGGFKYLLELGYFTLDDCYVNIFDVDDIIWEWIYVYEAVNLYMYLLKIKK